MKIADTSAQDTVLTVQPDRKKRYAVITVVALSLITVLWWAVPTFSRWGQAQDSMSLDQIRVATVTRESFIRDVTVPGRVVAAVSPVLYASDDGVITFSVAAGDTVKSGEELASIDSPELDNRLLQEESRLNSMRVELERQQITTQQQQLVNLKAMDDAAIRLNAAQRELTRAEQAFERGALSAVDLERARDDLETAQVLHRHAEMDAELDKERQSFEVQTRELSVEQQSLIVEDLKRQVANLTLLSPASGIVGNLLVEQKSSVSRNQPVMSVVDLSAFEVEVQIPESYVADLAIGMEAEIQLPQENLTATLVAISPEIVNNQVTGRLRFPESSPDTLRQNQRLTTRILLEQRENVLTLPRGQFIESGSGRFVYIIENGLAHRRPITMGATSLSHVEIIDGVQEGERVIVSSTDAVSGAEAILINN
ncbi:ABC transporter permease [Pseudohongiella nitratireducens]|uniref:ABC transporter permease n=1 Tax=Pseudohongiella nitratireducens TaxID=1768907 RepID=A0A916VJF9_9GAMM|nr:efflux RND transporter periplasmic adaptor subunit [Pseudohongiella nitratireducens]GFZ79653.1 ABC transporter permease [Pseudohongiella nitratireducens]